ncbi:MAG: hypothetical protein SFY56_15825 [Bacteroidota bacterium]|nr:hypothetical protein [Bacteroidota bacterium]
MDTIASTKIFLSTTNIDKDEEEKRLQLTLERAGFLFSNDFSTDLINSESYFTKINDQIKNSACSVHYIGQQDFNYINNIAIDEYHFEKVSQKIKEDEAFKVFIWMPNDFSYSKLNDAKIKFITKIQNHLSANMTLSRVPSAIQFIEDIRIVLEEHSTQKFDTVPTDVFLIYNETDDAEVSKIEGMLTSILKFTKLKIVQDSDIDYEEFASQQMNVSKLSVIFYKNATDWALPFVQQIWKKVGGATSKSQILFIGDESVKSDNANFKAPKVISTAVPSQLIPLEIKVQFDKINEHM